MLSPSSHIEVAVECHAELGEGPLWDERERCLYWVDTIRGELHRLDERGHSTQPIGVPLPAVIPSIEPGRLIILGRDTVVWGVGAEADELARIPLPEVDMRLNDAKCDPAGRLWAGTMSTVSRPTGALYSIDACLHVEERVAGLTISNGLGWSPDGSRMYHVDTPSGRLDEYEFDPDTGELGRKRALVEIDPSAGLPDGLCVDTDGSIWIALWCGGAIHRYSPNGTLEQVVAVPTHCPTSCCFGGAAHDVLYVTSSRAGAAEAGADLEHAGALFRVSVGVKGMPASHFKMSLACGPI